MIRRQIFKAVLVAKNIIGRGFVAENYSFENFERILHSVLGGPNPCR